MRISDWISDVCSSDLRQLQDRNDRKKYELPERPRMPPIDDRAQWNNNYLSGSADWVNFETTVSTSSGQIALAPGYLQRKWTKDGRNRSEEHTSELQSLMRISYAVFCLKKKKKNTNR